MTFSAALGALGCHHGPGTGSGYDGPTAIMFVSQVPVSAYTSLTAPFANHTSRIIDAPRGGDLHILYPDGKLRNLTKEAGYGVEGLQGSKGIAVRQPAVHWSGKKALFSMIVGGAGKQFVEDPAHWQIYEVDGLDEGDTATIKLVPGQPTDYNNISPFYGTDDAVLFTSDRPRNGSTVLYPQLDEYESAPIVTGLWRLDPSSGNLTIIEHAASGVFYPSIDSAGRVIFTKWDHLQQDQQAAADRYQGGSYGSFTYQDEGSEAVRANNDEVFPEALFPDDPTLVPGVSPHLFNQFMPWMINEDGTGEETLNHVGRHEIGGTYQDGSFTDDPNLTYDTPESDHKNRYYVDGFGGMFHFREDPTTPGTFYCTNSEEFSTDTAGALLKINGGEGVNPEDMVVTTITDPKARKPTDETGSSDPNHPGHFRNPLPLSDGSLVAAHSPESRLDKQDGDETNPAYRYAFRLKKLVKDGNYWTAGDPLTPGIKKEITYYNPDSLITISSELWELDPVEVRPRDVPDKRVETLPDPEASVLSKKGVDEQALRQWLADNGLALIVTRDVTARDRADIQQPYNLQVPGGVQTIGKPGKIYDVAFFQLFQADQIRGYQNLQKGGRRVLAQPMHDPAAKNPPSAGPAGSVTLGKDGSMAALVPAGRAMTWQLVDPNGKPVVRERNWVSFAAGEIRACPSCHGINTQDQSGRKPPTNEPAALADFIDYWMTLGK